MDNLNLINDIFTADAFSRINIVMIQKMGLAAAIVCDELEQRDNYWVNKNKKEWYATYEDIIEKTGLTYKQVVHSVKKLSNLGIVQSEPPVYEDGIKVKYYKINFIAKDKIMKSPYDGSYSRNYSPDKFIIYNKKLAQKIGPESTLILRDMCRTYIETAKRGKLVDGEWFESKQTKLAKKCGVTPKTMVDYIKKMVDQGLIEVKQMSWPKSTFVKINLDKLLASFGYGSWQEVADYLDHKAEEKAKKNANKVELITRLILDEVKKISGQQWTMSYDKLAAVEARLAEGHTQEELLQVVVDRYKSWVEDEELFKRYFNWGGVIGSDSSPSTVNSHLDSIRRKDIKEHKKLEAEKITATICNKMYEHSKGEVEWNVDDKKIECIRKILAWEENFTEEDLVSFVINRYDYNKKYGYKMKAFSSIFAKNEKEHMLKNRNVRQYNETKKLMAEKNYNKSYTPQNPEERSGISINMNADMRGVLTQAEVARREAEGEEVF